MEYSVKPEEHELRQARQEVENTLDTCEALTEKDQELEVVLGAKENGNFEERGAFGEAWNQNLIRIYFNSEHGDDWKKDLRKITAYSFGETVFMERSATEFWWQQILKKAFGLEVMERTGFEPEEIDRDEAETEWRERKEEEFQPGWSLAYLIGKKLMEDRELEDLPELNRSDVSGAGEELFGGAE